MRFIVSDEQDNEIVKYLEENCKTCIKICNTDSGKILCPTDKEERRFGVKGLRGKKIFLCTSRSQTKTSKLFKEKIEMLVYSIPSIEKIKESAFQEAYHLEREKYSKIVHNLKTLNAQSIQSQYKFIPQNVFSDNYYNLYDFVKGEIIQRPHDATIALLRLAKNNSHMKTEFSTHEKLTIEKPNLLIQEHNIRSVILNVYHSFDIEFRDNQVRFHISDNEAYLSFDYDTIRVALYHIFSNTIKYVRPRTVVNVLISESDSTLSVDFEMTSLHIAADEREKIFEDTYSGQSTKIKQKNGSGLGMGLIKKALTINNAKIEVLCGEKIYKSDNQEFSDNIFRLTFMKTI